MLTHLRIKNLALMDEAELEFDAGFTVVTGETGAGKSVLLGALGLLAGNRVAKTVVRRGTEQCEVEGVLEFAHPEKIDALLEELGLPPCEDGRLLLRRTVHVTKSGRILVNGANATLAQLERLGGAWIDFHGPGEPQKLFKESCQLEMLDLFAAHGDTADRYAGKYGEWRGVLRRIDDIASQEKITEDEADFIRGQLDRMNAVDLDDDAVAALERDFNRLSKAKELTSLIGKVHAGLAGDDGFSSQLPSLLRAAREVAAIDPEAAGLENRLNGLAIEIEDIASDYSRLAADTGDEETAEDIHRRMMLWLELKRKYGPDAAAVRAKRDALARKLALQGDIEGAIARAQAEADALEKELRALAAKLRARRLDAAETLAASARRLLGHLGFKKADLRIRVVDTEKLTETGDSACVFLFAPNAGQELLPLNAIASSGETARVMLALKTVLAGVDSTPVLVFDEVDANVGGEVGGQVGRELAALAGRHQVFCVTHLPQVAAQGRSHFRVEKSQTEDATTVTIAPLHTAPAEREGELARMLGDRKSASALSHARELLAAK